MMSYSFGDVVLVPFPFTDQTGNKKRPAVVVSSAAYNNSRPDSILMAITGQVKTTQAIGEMVVGE
jgi:mRNA interferase MazF